MRIAFFAPGADELTPQYKGKLFEQLTRRMLENCGYSDIVIRAKHNSLEYDVEGRHVLNKTLLVGEAKAHDANIPGKEISAFVGKLIPLLTRDSRSDAIFISTSPFTSEAEDYLSNFPEGVVLPNLSIRTLVGTEITELLISRGQCVGDTFLGTRLASLYRLELIDSWFMISERDEFLLCTCGPNLISRATHYACFDKHGDPLRLASLEQQRLENQLPELADLQPILHHSDGSDDILSRQLPGIAAGSGWFDYKFPAPPDCFVGRKEAIEQVQYEIEAFRSATTSVRTLQILSRSGVGKSSLLLKLSQSMPSAVSVVIDGRSLRAAGDLRPVISDLVVKLNETALSRISLPRSLDDVPRALQECANVLAGEQKVALLEIDQFESCLSIPSVFAEVIDLVSTSTVKNYPVVWVFARKNDVAVTFDESAQIDLARLNDMSSIIVLNDFTPVEGKELLNRLSEELGQAVKPDLGQAISTFSGGFPWLHKRLCAHVLSMHRNGISQRELVQTGLRAEDLFDEDLAGLDHQDLALLRTIAAHLPNTASELARRLEQEVSPSRLTQKLNEFLGRKLLRLSGDIYDTYNDVFKTYLVSERIPFQNRYVFRVTPAATFELLDNIFNLGPTDLSTLHSHLGGNRIAVLNKLRELRLLGLITSRPGIVDLSPEAKTAIEKNELPQLLRRSLRANELVTIVLDQLIGHGDLTVEQVTNQLKAELAHIEVTEETWKLYAGLLVAWLHYAGMIVLEGDTIRVQETPPDGLPRERQFSHGTFKPGTFLPSVRPHRVKTLLEHVAGGPFPMEMLYSEFGPRHSSGLLRDALALDLVEATPDGIVLGRQGRILVARQDSIIERDIAQLALMKDNVKAIMSQAAKKPLNDDNIKELLKPYGSAKWTPQTWRWRLGIMRSWLVATGQARSTRLGLKVN